MSCYDDEDQAMEEVTTSMERFQFTGMDRVNSTGTEDSWEVESYAADSMEIDRKSVV